MPAGHEVTGGSGSGLTPPSAPEEADCIGEEFTSWEGLMLCVPRRPAATSPICLVVPPFLLSQWCTRDLEGD